MYDTVCVCVTVKLLLKPPSPHSPVGLGDTKETSFCNVTDDISVTDPRKGERAAGLPSPAVIGGRSLPDSRQEAEWGEETHSKRFSQTSSKQKPQQLSGSLRTREVSQDVAESR